MSTNVKPTVVEPFDFFPDQTRRRAADWPKLSQDVINDVTKHYLANPDAAKNLKTHVSKFRLRLDHRDQVLRGHKSKWAKHDPDGDGLIQAEHLGAYMQDIWGFNPGPFAIKYWKAINAYDSSYNGIKVEDFSALNHFFDEQSILSYELEQQAEGKIPDYCFDPVTDRPHAPEFHRLAMAIVNDVYRYWSKKSHRETFDLFKHTIKFEESEDYQKELFYKAHTQWVKFVGKDGIMKDDSRMHDFCHTQFGFNPGPEFGKRYWQAMNAYDSSYEGVKVEDWLECWVMFDRKGIEQVLGPKKKFPVYRFDPERVRPKADNFSEIETELVEATRNHWKNQPQVAQFGQMDTFYKFKNVESLQNSKFQNIARKMDTYLGQDGTLEQDQMGKFLEDLWGTSLGPFGLRYWAGVNAYDSSYEGIKPEDFLECSISWDSQAMDFFQEPAIEEVFVDKENVEHAHDYQRLRDEVITDIRNSWASRKQDARDDQQAHLDLGTNDSEYKTRLYRRILSHLVKHDKDGDGLLQQDEMPAFLKDMWGNPMGEFGYKYWRAVNAYDGSYQGFKAADFLTCWILFDQTGFTEIVEKELADD